MVDETPRDKKTQDSLVNYDGYANAQNTIDAWRKRLCYQATPDARELAEDFKYDLHEVEPEWSDVLVPNCIYRAGCPEFKSCGYWESFCKKHKDENPALTGFVGFGCSFGGKWFGGYARNNTNTNYALQSKRSVMKDVSNLINAKFTCLDYKDVEIPKGSIVYADPPYANTTTYQGQKFDTNEFWDYMRQISKDNKVFISEQNAPDDFKCIWEKPFTRTLDRNKNNQFKVTEKLFTYKNSNL